MWPRRRVERYVPPNRRSAREQPDRTPRTPRAMRAQAHQRHNLFTENYEDSDDEAVQGSSDNEQRVEVLLLTSIQTLTLMLLEHPEEPSVTAGMRVLCQVLSVPLTDCRWFALASSSCSDDPPSAVELMLQEITNGLMEDESDSTYNEESINEVSVTDDESSLSSVSSSDSGDNSDTSDSTIYSQEYTTVCTSRPLRRSIMLRARPIRQPTNARQRLRFAHRMPAPSMLATQVANRVIKYARCVRNTYENQMCCLTCGLFPINPVTGMCGHTRCYKCVKSANICACGDPQPEESMHVNIVIRDLIEKTVAQEKLPRVETASTSDATNNENPAEAMEVDEAVPNNQKTSESSGASSSALRPSSLPRTYNVNSYSSRRWRIPMSPRARYNQALELLQMGQQIEAAPLLALAAASQEPDVQRARGLLAQCIEVVTKDRDPRRLTRQLFSVIREKSKLSWLKPGDLECILCCDTFTNPVTTPCGHMFCRICIERSMDYRKRCPLCLRPLSEFNLILTRDTMFVTAALSSIHVVKTIKPLEPDVIPIFVCTVAFPTMPCPLLIFDPRYWLMIRRVLESGSRKFGMVASDRNRTYSEFGTILEVRDCVHLEDGRSILSTVGLSRFKVIERCVRDGCEVARILPIVDTGPADYMELMDFKTMSSQVMFKAMSWVKRLNKRVKDDIIEAFGEMVPPADNSTEVWYSADGPAWLWWVLAVLPLRSEIKVLILSTNCIFKRMMAVSRTLEAVDQVTMSTPTAAECRLRHALAPENEPIPSTSVNAGNVAFNVYATSSSETAE